MNNIILEIDRFLWETVGAQDISYPEKKRRAEELLRGAERIFPTVRGEPQRQLNERINRLRNTLIRWQKEDEAYRRPVYMYRSLREKRLDLAQGWLSLQRTSSMNPTQKLVQTKRLLVELQQVATPPTPEEDRTIKDLEALLRELQGKKIVLGEPEPAEWEAELPQGRIQASDVGIPRPIVPKAQALASPDPPILAEAQSFFMGMKDKDFRDVASLNSAVREGENLFRRLNATLSGLSPADYRRWQASFEGEIKGVGSLISKWKSQLREIGEREREARSYALTIAKTKEEKETYLASKQRASSIGKTLLDYRKALREAMEQGKIALSTSQMIRSKVDVEKTPEALPIADLSRAITAFESLLARVNGNVPPGDLREAEAILKALTTELKIVENAYTSLQYEEAVERYAKALSSKGVAYFRGNLPEGVKEVLPARDISKLESLASTGINGAKEAIEIAISLVAKRSVEKAKEILGT